MVAVGGIGEGAEQMALAHGQFDCLARNRAEIFDGIVTRKPLLDDCGILPSEALGELDDELIAIAEVFVKGGTREAGSRHNVVDGHIAQRGLAEKLLRRAQDLRFRGLRLAASATCLALRAIGFFAQRHNQAMRLHRIMPKSRSNASSLSVAKCI